MKIAVTSESEGLDSNISNFFGRCPYFIIVEINEDNIKGNRSVRNSAMNQRGGAGISAAQIVGDNNVEAVISGNVGPRAFDVLSQLGIEVYQAVPGSVKENVEKFIEGNLEKLESPGPMGRGRGGPGRGRGGGAGQGRGMNR